MFDFDKTEGSFTGRTTLEQLKEIVDKIAAALQGQEDHIRIVSDVLGHREGTRKEKAGSDGRRYEKEDSGIRGGNANRAGDIGYGRFMSRKPTSDTARGASEMRQNQPSAPECGTPRRRSVGLGFWHEIRENRTTGIAGKSGEIEYFYLQKRWLNSH